ncbi:MAG: hypothetical protein KDK78_09950, partial [Chlamydiia bacterium]|nr:hypothetical protein [Chlamydiia bacterium]
LAGIFGEPQVLPYLRDVLPISLQHVCTVIAQVARDILSESRLYRIFIDYSEASEVNQELWANVRADARLRSSIENTVLIIADNTLRHFKGLVRKDPEREFLLDILLDGVALADRHFSCYQDALHAFPNGGAKRSEWLECCGPIRHEALEGDPALSADYYEWAGTVLLGIGLPREGAELEHIARLAQPEAYGMVKGIMPDIVMDLKQRALSPQSINHLVVQLIRLLRKPNHTDSMGHDALVRPYSRQGELNRRLGCMIRRCACCISPRLCGALFGVFNLEGMFGRLLGNELTKLIRTTRLDALIDKGANATLAAICEGGYVEDPSGDYRFQPELEQLDDGIQGIRLASRAGEGSRTEMALRAETDLAEFMRDLVPQAIFGQWDRFWFAIDSFCSQFSMLKMLVRPRQWTFKALGLIARTVCETLYLDQAANWLGLRIARPLARRILSFS